MSADVEVILGEAAQVRHTGDVWAFPGSQLNRQLRNHCRVRNDIDNHFGAGVRSFKPFGLLGSDVALNAILVTHDADICSKNSGWRNQHRRDDRRKGNLGGFG